jgi:hypothetical protein
MAIEGRLGSGLLFLWVLTAWGAEKPVDFQRQIRPILSENCFQCHGPDSGTRMAGLRLDLKDGIFAARKGGAAVVPGDPSASLLYQRVSEKNPARRMPPEYSHKSLTQPQIDLLKRWIEEGAAWKEHWAFQAPHRPAPPAVHDAAWVRNDIDRFILARLESQGLAPAPAADARTLIRRVALDTVGLPPNPAELDLFLSDNSPDAYEHMVDRYLASPHYGEHRAQYWLDAARYADTHGIHIDNYREIWPYRDWVIQAFNRNMPFDQFTIEQLAGDLLPDATLEQRIATGFHRCNVTTNEAGIIEDEYAEIYAKDRADTTAAVWLGMTVGCATCHDHKFDPISQKDFYALGAFFRNTTQRVMDDNVPDTPPVVVVPRPEDRASWFKTTSRLAAIKSEMESDRAGADGAFQQWLETRGGEPVKHPLDEKDELYTADARALAKSGKHIVKLGDSPVAGRPAIHFLKNEGVPVANAPKLDSEKPFSISVSFLFPTAEQGYVVASQRSKGEKGRGWVIDVGGRVVGFHLDGDGGKGIEIRAAHLEQIKPGTWNHVVISYDGSRHQSGLDLYLNGQAIPTQGRGNQTVELKGDIAVDDPLILGKSLAQGAIADFRIFNRVVSESEAHLLSEWPAIEAALTRKHGNISDTDRAALRQYFLFTQYEPFRRLAAEQNTLNLKAKDIARRGAVTLVMHERTDAKPSAHVLYRGAYDQKRDAVDANTPSVLPPMTSELPRNRLGFAKWLFREDHPLTARVTVNRMWQEIFGAGIVRTVDDFGSQGEPPSHPELLDWLAVDFRESGWDVKRFYKQIFVSATYRQSAEATPDKIAKDPENRLLSRGPRFRLDAEAVRDYALAASGLLSPEIGGPSVKPYQPDGIWEAVAMEGSNTRFYKQDSGYAIYRRSLYTFWKRSAPPASMEIFNAPTRENCTVRRERTNTPLQALVTMNDVQFVEAAKTLAGRSMAAANGFDARLDFISKHLLARPLTSDERAIVRKEFDDFRAYYSDNPDDSEKLLNTGEKRADPGMEPAEYAALTMVANELMNLDEVLNK